MFYGLIEGSVSIPSGKENYISFGRGKKNLVIIQGLNVRDLAGSGASLANMYKIFAKEYRVYFFDRRLVVKEGLSINDLAEDIYHAMKELKIESADVLGISQGGMIGMTLALEHPEVVNKLVLGVTSSRPNETLKNVVGKWANCARNKDYITINKDSLELLYTQEYLKKYRFLMPLVVRLVKPADFDRFAILSSSILNFDCYDRLNEIKCPVLVLGGKRDRITTGKASEEIAEKLGCEIYMYDEYGHAAYDEAKDFNKRVYDFLAK
ncbi:MAG: alpha/beta hydrolase [Treponema sp.]|nr:alpha/beta hydrolase [Treponema sp.]